MMKLPNKYHEAHTTIKLHGETIAMTQIWQRSINVGLPISFSMLMVLTHVVLDPSKQGIE